jgi:hypothetical protein
VSDVVSVFAEKVRQLGQTDDWSCGEAHSESGTDPKGDTESPRSSKRAVNNTSKLCLRKCTIECRQPKHPARASFG